LLGKDTAEKVVKALISRLQKEGVVVLKGKKIEYKLTVGTA
jgi:DNA-binding transcriptional regulator PaaX